MQKSIRVPDFVNQGKAPNLNSRDMAERICRNIRKAWQNAGYGGIECWVETKSFTNGNHATEYVHEIRSNLVNGLPS